MTDYDRRTVVRGLGVLTVTGALAGCTGGGGGGDDTTESGGSNGDTDTTAAPDTTTSGGGGGMSVPDSVSSYLSDVSNFDGSLTDETGQDSVTITVGAQGNNGNFGFGPAAVVVDAGTTVTWEWNGKGGQHNVVAEDGGSFESDLVAESGHTFEHTFESSGAVTYYCQPHKALGMKGAVVVR